MAKVQWKIYYGDGSVFSDADGTPWEAPRRNVQFIVTRQQHNAKYLLLSGADYYTFQEEFQWYYCTMADMYERLFTTGSNQLFLVGLMIDWDLYCEISRKVHQDVKDMGLVKDSWRHMPLQQNTGSREELG